MVRELVGTAVECVIGEVLVFKEDGDGLGRAGGLVFNELMDKRILRERDNEMDAPSLRHQMCQSLSVKSQKKERPNASINDGY
ncbi:hypothetical protein V6M93_21720 [Pectobacterium brasiliense]|uniref:hypothetical protein n=1 Tax=Pectobacterium brasiliense TaxID=180957 RepID=UPI00366DE982